MFGRLWRQRRLIVLNCVAAFVTAMLNPGVLAPVAAFAPPGMNPAIVYTVLVFAVSLVVGHLFPRWRWMVFSLVAGYAVGDHLAHLLLPQLAEVAPKQMFVLDEANLPSAPGPVLIVAFTIASTLILRILGGLADGVRKKGVHESVVGGLLKRPRDEVWELIKPETTRQHWHPGVERVERDKLDPALGHVIYWKKLAGAPLRRVRLIEDVVPGVQYREVIADDPRSSLTKHNTGATGWLLEEHPQGTFLTMREQITGLGRMTILWRWFDDYERDMFAFLRAHLEGGRDWSLHGLDIVEGEA